MIISEEKMLDICIRTKILFDRIDNLDIDLRDCTQDFREIKDTIDSILTEPSHLLKIADLHFKSGNMDKALDIYEGMEVTDDREVLSRIGEIYMKTKDYDKAGVHFDRMIEMFEDDPSVWFNKANLYFESETALEDSVFYLEKALELNADYIDALILMAEVWLERSGKKRDDFIKRRMLKEAAKCLDSAERQNDDEPSLAKELNFARIMSLRAKVEPEKKEELEKSSLDYLEKALETDEDMKPVILEKIRNERAFESIDILMDEASADVEVSRVEEEEDKETPEETEDISIEAESIKGISIEEVESEFIDEPRDIEVSEEEIGETIITELEEKTEDESIYEGDHILSPGDLIREGKKQIRRRKKQQKGDISKISILRPDELD